MLKEQYVSELSKGDVVNSSFSIKYIYNFVEYKNGLMFLIGLSDKTGDIESVYWGGIDRQVNQNLHDELKEGDVINVIGTVGEYKNKLKIDIKEGMITHVKNYEIEDYILKTKEDLGQMLSYILTAKNAVQDNYLKALLDGFLEDEKFLNSFKTSPAALRIHHAYSGGLLEHSVNVLKICEALYSIYPKNLNKDLLIVGAILHDIGKIEEYTTTTTNIKITEEGMLLGHITLGVKLLFDKIIRIQNFPDLTKNKLVHILLSHHGKNVYGSPVEPSIPEAVAIYYADETDSKMNQYIEIIGKANGNKGFHIYNARLGNVFTK